MHSALLTCPAGRSTSVLARTQHVFRSPYVPGQPQCFRPGTDKACFTLFLRARTAAVPPSRHGLSMHSALLTCPAGHSNSFPARTQRAFRSSYVSGRPQNFPLGTYSACISLFLRARPASAPPSRHGLSLRHALLTCLASRSTPTPARIRLASCSSYVPGQPQHPHPGTDSASISLFLRARPASLQALRPDRAFQVPPAGLARRAGCNQALLPRRARAHPRGAFISAGD